MAMSIPTKARSENENMAIACNLVQLKSFNQQNDRIKKR